MSSPAIGPEGAALTAHDFDYVLPPEAIAQEPCRPRDAARLLHVDRASGVVAHLFVRDLPELLTSADLLVANDTRVRPARLFGRRATGGAVELLVLGAAPEEGPAACRAMARPAAKLAPGERVALEGGRLFAVPLRRSAETGHWLVRLEPAEGEPSGAETPDWIELIERHGRMPLPPYVERPRDDRALDARDREDYQTIFAAAPGAVAAPTAGLHFTPALLEALDARGVERAQVTLHVGPGTFRPVTAERIDEHEMHTETFRLAAETVEAVSRCRARGGRVVAVGTTTARVLESCAGPASEDDAGRGELRAQEGETRLFIAPGYRFRAVDALLTNFHLPRSTLLMLVSALVGRERVLALYREALARGYRFTSYGDAMLIT